MSSEIKLYDTCEICGRRFQFGPHVYNGQRIPAYEITVCKVCFDGNWDGWGMRAEPVLIAHLKSRGIPIPERNAQGFIPRGD